MFERTVQGVRNRRLFYGSDLLVYCEGDPVRESPSLDVHFWQIVFDAAVKRTSKIVPYGSKADVLKLLNDTSGDPAVFYAVDSDIEHITDRSATSQLVKTFSYSFESDLVAVEILEEWIDRLPIGRQRLVLRNDFRSTARKLQSTLVRLGLLNVKRRVSQGKGIGKEASDGLLDFTSCALSAAFAAEWRAAGKTNGRMRLSTTSARWFLNCCPGETALRLHYQWFRRWFEKAKVYKMPAYSVFVESVLGVQQKFIESGRCERFEYYQRQIT